MSVAAIAVGVAGAGLVWLSLALAIGVLIGRAVRHADLAEGTAGEPPARAPGPLLGVVGPREPADTLSR